MKAPVFMFFFFFTLVGRGGDVNQKPLAEQYGFLPVVSYFKTLNPFLKFQKAGADDSSTPQFQYEMGKRYRTGGQGTDQNFQKAVDWFLKAARRGHLEAQYELSHFSSHDFGPGLNTPVISDKEALKWLKRAALGGHIKAQSTIGNHHLYQALQGHNLSDPHFKMARFWLEKTSSTNVNSEYLLAVLNTLDLPRQKTKEAKTTNTENNQKRWQSIQKKSAKLLPDTIVFSIDYIRPWYLKVTRSSLNPSCRKTFEQQEKSLF